MSSNPFAPGGVFADNIRYTRDDDLTELVESLKLHGWLAEFPALADEDGTVLVGHRRMKAAELAGIEPVIKTLTFGEGDTADAERVRLAIVSNIGTKPMTKQDRERIARHLYGSRNWTMQAIADALGVTKMTISNDLGDCKEPLQLKPHAKTPNNPKGAGRPKAEARTTTAGVGDTTRKIREQVRPLVERDEPINVQNVMAATGHSRIVTEAAIAAERGRLDGIREAAVLAPVDVSTLGKTSREQMAALEKRLRVGLEAEFEQRVREEVRSRLARRDAEDILAVEQANALILQRSGRTRPPFTPQEYYELLRALHPDTKAFTGAECFRLVRTKKLILCDEGPIHRKSSEAPLPKTVEDLMRAREAKRSARRSGGAA